MVTGLIAAIEERLWRTVWCRPTTEVARVEPGQTNAVTARCLLRVLQVFKGPGPTRSHWRIERWMLSERREWLGAGTSLAGDMNMIRDTRRNFAEKFDRQGVPQAGATARGSFAAAAVTSVYTPPW